MATYDKLIGPDGQPRFGRFSRPVAIINHRDFYYTDPFDHKASFLARHFDLKQFQFIGLISEDYILGCAITSLKYVSTAFVYLVDRRSNRVQEKSLVQPLSLNCQMSNEPDAGEARFHQGSTSFIFRSFPGQKHVRIVSGRDIHIDFTLTEPSDFQPVAVCTRTGFNGWTYTQKANALRAEGNIVWNNRRIAVESPAFLGSYDWSCGYMRRQTAWNWASLSGTLPHGRSFGANLASGVNETGFTENAIWIDGQQTTLGPVLFDFDKRNRNRPWHIRDMAGRIELIFTPESGRQEKVNLWLLATNFTQLTGRFRGSITDEHGQRLTLANISGFCEDHYAKW